MMLREGRRHAAIGSGVAGMQTPPLLFHFLMQIWPEYSPSIRAAARRRAGRSVMRAVVPLLLLLLLELLLSLGLRRRGRSSGEQGPAEPGAREAAGVEPTVGG